MNIIDNVIYLYGKRYRVIVKALPEDDIEPEGEAVHRVLQGVKETIEIYQNQVEDEI